MPTATYLGVEDRLGGRSRDRLGGIGVKDQRAARLPLLSLLVDRTPSIGCNCSNNLVSPVVWSGLGGDIPRYSIRLSNGSISRSVPLAPVAPAHSHVTYITSSPSPSPFPHRHHLHHHSRKPHPLHQHHHSRRPHPLHQRTQIPPTISIAIDLKKPISVIRRRPIPLKKTGAPFSGRLLHHAALTLSHHLQKNPSLLYHAQTHLALFRSSSPKPARVCSSTSRKSVKIRRTGSRAISPREGPSPLPKSPLGLLQSRIGRTILTTLFSLDWQRTRNALIFSSFSELLSPRLIPLFFPLFTLAGVARFDARDSSDLSLRCGICLFFFDCYMLWAKLDTHTRQMGTHFPLYSSLGQLFFLGLQ
ncbi:hypothetical protein CKAN_00856300 [Cinnamomum micranthum f. kanehirae]|uniref:Uncharacterized protein n=1 Tax=Cinnamomum micranthum f. kanehirae TaxID=337451 RepID=A0A443NNA0_9MAGN|nr:hypothetical protein CKAN_00856300 [Cinnamomum micranthum f. kanehirae]